MNLIPRSRAANWIADARKFVAETPVSALVALGVGTVSLLFALGLFFNASSLTSVALLVFLASAAYGWVRHRELTARAVTMAMTASTILILALIVVFIFVEAWPIFDVARAEAFGISVPGLRLFTQTEWAPRSAERYSLLPLIHGTVMVTLVATLVAGPLGVASALFVSEIAPPAVREVVKPGIEILAGIPSIVYGFIGFTIISPWASEQFDLVGQGTYLFVGIVVGLMALPTVVSVAEDALNSVPESMKDGSLALGTTDW